MRASDITPGNIYNVIFDPVRDCEFSGKHLAVVLKKNNDGATFIVVPLTSSSNGVGVNKLYIGKIDSLPSSLRNNDAYAVFNQTRTVNASRFITLKDGDRVVDVRMPKQKFYELLILSMRELIHNVNQNDRIELLKSAYEQESLIKAKDIAYNILRLENKGEENSSSIFESEQEIKRIIQNIPYNLDQKYIDDGVGRIFERALKDNNSN